jgi:hypothetical protein
MATRPVALANPALTVVAAAPFFTRVESLVNVNDGVPHKNRCQTLTYEQGRLYHDPVSQTCPRPTWKRSTHPVLGLFLIVAISACALWGAMDLLVRVFRIDWPI